jgi:hypothetical protein
MRTNIDQWGERFNDGSIRGVIQITPHKVSKNGVSPNGQPLRVIQSGAFLIILILVEEGLEPGKDILPRGPPPTPFQNRGGTPWVVSHWSQDQLVST